MREYYHENWHYQNPTLEKLVAKFEMGTRACAILVLGEVPMLVREVSSFNLELSALNLREYKSC